MAKHHVGPPAGIPGIETGRVRSRDRHEGSHSHERKKSVLRSLDSAGLDGTERERLTVFFPLKEFEHVTANEFVTDAILNDFLGSLLLALKRAISPRLLNVLFNAILTKGCPFTRSTCVYNKYNMVRVLRT